MWTIEQKLDYLEQTKEIIRQSILSKGIEVSNMDTFRSYADKIREINVEGHVFKAPEGIRFNGSTMNEMPMFDMSHIKNMDLMFYNCRNLTSIPDLDTSSVTSMTQTFEKCESLSEFPYLMDFSNVKNMSNTFNGCKSLHALGDMHTANVTEMVNLFSGCTNLQRIESIDFKSLTSMNGMFDGCDNLAYLTINDMGSVASMVKYDLSALKSWGDSSKVTDSRQSIIDSLYNSTFDRKAAGYPIAEVKLDKAVKSYFSQAMIEFAEKKGFKITDNSIA